MTLKSTVLMTLRSTVRRLAWVGGAMTLAASLSCMDLTVTNNNNPDRVRATNTPGDVEGLIAGTFQRFGLFRRRIQHMG